MADNRENAAQDLAYGHESHREFNERLASRNTSRSVRADVTGPWLSNEVVARLPNSKRDFDQCRDPMVRAQLQDMAGSGPKRQEDKGGRGSTMVGKDKPELRPAPPKETGRASDREKFRNSWLLEQRDAVLARATAQKGKSNDCHAPSRKPREPSR